MEFSSSISLSERVSSSYSSCLYASRSKPCLRLARACADASIPKMEPFNRSRVSRLVREPSLLEKAEHDISDRCSILEGDDAYRCWEALFDLEKMKEEYSAQCNVASPSERQTACRPLERLKNVVRQSGGVVSLINNVRMLAKVNKMQESMEDRVHAQYKTPQAGVENSLKGEAIDDGHLHFFPEPGALPPSEEELELERNAKMPESPFTRVLRVMAVPSPWFSQAAY